MKKIVKSWLWWQRPLVLALRRQEQEHICKCEASQVYMASSRLLRTAAAAAEEEEENEDRPLCVRCLQRVERQEYLVFLLRRILAFGNCMRTSEKKVVSTENTVEWRKRGGKRGLDFYLF